MTTAAQLVLGAVNAPPAKPPVHGLIQTLGQLGPDYLIDGTTETVDDVINGSDGNPTARTSMVQRWVGGFEYATEQDCTTGVSSGPCDFATALTPPTPPAWVTGIPIMAWAAEQASSFGFEARDYMGRAIRRLIAAESKMIAAELWAGTVAQAEGWTAARSNGQPGVQYLASTTSNVSVLTAGGASPSDALALLEEGIAQTSNGQQGMIHCTPQIGAYFGELGNTLRNVDGTVQTYRGTLIVADAGYPGTSPAGTGPATTTWAYGTLIPQVRRSPINVYPEQMSGALDRSINQVTYRAERYLAATFPPCTLVAVEVTAPLPAVVGG